MKEYKAKDEYDYIIKIQDMLLDNMNEDYDCSPNGMAAIMSVSKEYENKVEDDVIDRTIEEARWVIKYLMHCRHGAKRIDAALVAQVVALIAPWAPSKDLKNYEKYYKRH